MKKVLSVLGGTDGGWRRMMRSICSEEEKAFWKEVWLISLPLKPGWVRIRASANHISLYLCLKTISWGNVNSKSLTGSRKPFKIEHYFELFSLQIIYIVINKISYYLLRIHSFRFPNFLWI